MIKIVIFGGSGKTGQLVTRRALDEQYTVTIVTRHPDKVPFQDEHLRVVKGDVLDTRIVEPAVAAQDAVLSLIGVPYSRHPITIYSESMAAILGAMHAVGTKRLACVSSGGVNPRRDPEDGFIFNWIIKPIFGKTTYNDIRRMEQLVTDSDLNWTMVRPGRLFDAPNVSSYQVAENAYRVGKGFPETSRADLADFMLKQVEDHRYIRKAVAISSKRSSS
jgi:putative NADH-flavin reductase